MKSQIYKNIFADAKNILIIVIIFHGINSVFWFKNDGYIQHGCHSVWLEKNSLGYSKILLDDSAPVLGKVLKTLDSFKLSRHGCAFSTTNFNLTSLFIAFPSALCLDGHVKLFLINAILFLQLVAVLFAIYCLGKIVFNKAAGSWSAIIFSFYPGVIGLSRKSSAELLVTFFVIVSIIIFVRWDNLARIFRSLLLLAVFIMGVFSGGLFLVFFIPLFLLHLSFIFFSRSKKMENLSEFIILLCLILFFFHFYLEGEYSKFFLNLKKGLVETCEKLTSQSKDFIGSADYGVIKSFLFAPQDSSCPCTQTANVGINVKTFLFYIMESIYYTSYLLFVLAVFSFPFFIKNKKIDFYKKMLVWMWVSSGYLFLSLFYIKWGKFITPVLPALALASGVFISDYSERRKFIKPILVSVGILTALYYSYFSMPYRHFLEELTEGITAHRPIKSKFIEVAEQIGTKIDNLSEANDSVNIFFLDKESSRFQGSWVADKSVRVGNLIGLFLKRKHQIKDFWELSDNFYYNLSRQDFIVLIAQREIGDIEEYLYPEKAKRMPGLKFDMVYKGYFKSDVFIYLFKISKI